jgi:glyoxylase-like metal-dependent hydrolase (beta-lactamase superfamily II)
MEIHPMQLYGLGQRFDFCILKEEDILNIGDYTFRCIETPGHSPGHICLYDASKKVLVAGDHVLSTITPNIAYWPELDNPLKHYLASLEKVEPLDVEVVLPAHRNIFYNFRTRIAELMEHHRARLNQILVALDGTAMTAFDIAPHIKWDIKYASWELFPPAQKWFATGETISHLRLLEETGQLRRQTRGQQIVFSLT